VLISAFVIGTTVVFAPLIAWILLRRRLTTRAAAAVLLALVGLAMITVRSFAVGPGTLLILTAAVLWAVHLVALERWSRAGRLYGLTLIQLAASAAVALGCQVLLDDGQGLWQPLSGSAAAGIFFLGAAATGGAFVALGWAQTRLDATTAAVILTLEPVVGAGLGIALGDPWTAATVAGAIAVLAAVWLVARPASLALRCRSNHLSVSSRGSEERNVRQSGYPLLSRLYVNRDGMLGGGFDGRPGRDNPWVSRSQLGRTSRPDRGIDSAPDGRALPVNCDSWFIADHPGIVARRQGGNFTRTRLLGWSC
jgi:EamA-like transporter family